MKKSILTTICLFLAAGLIAQEWHGLQSERPTSPKIILATDTENQKTIEFELGGFFSQQIETPSGIQTLITVPKMASRLEAGFPDLPQIPVPVIIGDLSEMSVSISESEFTDLHGIEIIPSKGNISRQIDPSTIPYRYGPTYQKDVFFPEETAILDTPYIIRDFRGQNIIITPFQYNAITRTLRVFTKMTIVMEKANDKGKNVKQRRKNLTIKADPETVHHYQRRFINYNKESEKYAFTEDRGEMLIICPKQYMGAMQPFVDWKNQSGRPTTMVSVEEAGGNNCDNIKAYLTNYYQNHNLLFILLVGDYNDITPKQVSGGYSDSWFGQLEGSDRYVEALVGRFSVENENDVETHVNKVIYYERDMTSDQEWIDKGIGIGSTDGSGIGHHGELDWQHIDYIRDTLMHYTYTEVSQRYDKYNAPTASLLSQDFNNGASICNYCNHGSETSWSVCNYSNSNVKALTNDYRWPCIVSVACLNGKFNHYQPCFGETWMRAKNPNTGAPTGAIGGMFSWITQPWAPPQYGQDEMAAILTGWRTQDGNYNHTMGGTFLNGNEYILDAAPSDLGLTHDTWFLFGDPSLLMRTTNPTEISVSCTPDILMLGAEELTISADIEYGIATLSINGNVLASEIIHNGFVTLHFAPLEEVGHTTLTVIGFNKVTYIQNIDIVPLEGAYVMLDNYQIHDDNGQLDFGEETGLSITVKNVGVEIANNITARLTSSSEFIEIIHGETQIASLGIGEQISVEGAFILRTNKDVPYGTTAAFTLTCTSPGGTWTSAFVSTIHTPRLELAEITDNGNAGAGSGGTLTIKIKNHGNSTSWPGMLQLFSSSEDVSFQQTTYHLASILANETCTFNIPYFISTDAAIGAAYEVDFFASAGFYSLNGETLVTVDGNNETYETGDFRKYNWMFSGSNWVIDNTMSHKGNYSARSGATTNNHTSEMILSLQVLNEGEISFWVRTSSETNCDKLHFYIDNSELGVWSGYQDPQWEKACFPMTTGFHLLRWVYSKDSSSAQGQDCVWIDDIQFPPLGITSNMPAVENLHALTEGNTVSLTWDRTENSHSYIIKRDGTQIASQDNTSFSETLADGIYNYCVIATDNEGHYSIPSHIIVEVGILDTNEIINNFKIYPNPAKDIINIDNFPYPYQYVVYNHLGQTIATGDGNGLKQLDTFDWRKGLYFIKITQAGQSIIQKIIIR